MQAKRVGLIAVLLAAAWAGWSCKDEITGEALSSIVFPDSNVSYGRHVEPLFHRGCAYGGCHSADSKADGLSLDNYQDALSSKINVIIPGDTAASRLLWSIEERFGRPLMPPRTLGGPLVPNQIQGLRRWILEGARNN